MFKSEQAKKHSSSHRQGKAGQKQAQNARQQKRQKSRNQRAETNPSHFHIRGGEQGSLDQQFWVFTTAYTPSSTPSEEIIQGIRYQLGGVDFDVSLPAGRRFEDPWDGHCTLKFKNQADFLSCVRRRRLKLNRLGLTVLLRAFKRGKALRKHLKDRSRRKLILLNVPDQWDNHTLVRALERFGKVESAFILSRRDSDSIDSDNPNSNPRLRKAKAIFFSRKESQNMANCQFFDHEGFRVMVEFAKGQAGDGIQEVNSSQGWKKSGKGGHQRHQHQPPNYQNTSRGSIGGNQAPHYDHYGEQDSHSGGQDQFEEGGSDTFSPYQIQQGGFDTNVFNFQKRVGESWVRSNQQGGYHQQPRGGYKYEKQEKRYKFNNDLNQYTNRGQSAQGSGGHPVHLSIREHGVLPTDSSYFERQVEEQPPSCYESDNLRYNLAKN